MPGRRIPVAPLAQQRVFGVADQGSVAPPHENVGHAVTDLDTRPVPALQASGASVRSTWLVELTAARPPKRPLNDLRNSQP